MQTSHCKDESDSSDCRGYCAGLHGFVSISPLDQKGNYQNQRSVNFKAKTSLKYSWLCPQPRVRPWSWKSQTWLRGPAPSGSPSPAWSHRLDQHRREGTTGQGTVTLWCLHHPAPAPLGFVHTSPRAAICKALGGCTQHWLLLSLRQRGTGRQITLAFIFFSREQRKALNELAPGKGWNGQSPRCPLALHRSSRTPSLPWRCPIALSPAGREDGCSQLPSP